MTSDPAVVVARFRDANHARIVRNYLRQEGIRCELAGDHQGALPGILDLQIIVSESDAQRARHLIARHPRRGISPAMPYRRFEAMDRWTRFPPLLLPPSRIARRPRSALSSFHRQEAVRTSSKRRGGQAKSNQG